MNQIVSILLSNKEKQKLKKKYVFLLFIFIIICIFLLFIYFFKQYEEYKNENLSQTLINKFNITSLYSDNHYYDSNYLQQEESLNLPFVIGIIKIEKLNLYYPILSHTSKENLKVAPCKFYGPPPNEIGNLCIAGHNYVDNKLFSKIHTLDKDDCIKISDLTGHTTSYYVYSIYEVFDSDLSCTSQDTHNKREITLITCNNVNGTRVIVKASEKK